MRPLPAPLRAAPQPEHTLRRWRGYILLEPEAELQYSTETKELTLVLNAGFYGTNMDFIKGCPPPDAPANLGKNPRFDIVERKWLRRSAAGVISEARALAHFGLS